MKPRLGSRGRHTLTYINTREDLKKAYHIAKQLCLWVIVEEQLFGPVYRGTVINYRLEGIFVARQPFVTGDGKSTIHDLIAHKNTTKIAGVADVEISPKMTGFVTRELQSLGRITPSDGYPSWLSPLPR